jgi:uncharacterized protein YjbI with pentapeptide repeats
LPSDTGNGRLTLEDVRARLTAGGSLAGAIMQEMDLQGCNFRNVNLTGALFQDVNVAGSDFSNADLSDAIFLSSNLDRVRARSTKMKDVTFTQCHGEACEFVECDLRGSGISTSDFSRTHWKGSNLESVAIIQSNLSGGSMMRCRLVDAWGACQNDRHGSTRSRNMETPAMSTSQRYDY